MLVDIAIVLLRVVSGLLYLQHGGQKLFHWFGGVGVGGHLPFLLLLASLIELVGGTAVLLGIFTRPIAFIISGEMAVAFFYAHFPHRFWPIQNHGETAVLLCFIFFFFFAYGAGKWSVDNLILHKK